MKPASPSLEVWRKLHEAADGFKAIEAWTWMSDASIFGVRDPVTGTVAYCSVIGELGELLGLVAYLGAVGLRALDETLSSNGDYSDINLGKDMKCLMATFQSRRDLDKPDLETIRQLGLSFRGKQNWPVFRSYEPGFLPWYLTEDQAIFLTLILQQAAEVCLRAKDDPDLLATCHEGLYLVRVAETCGEGIVWKDQLMPREQLPEGDLVPPIQVDELRVVKVRNAARATSAVWDADVFYAPACIGENGKSRPYFPFMCLWVDRDSELILGMETAEHDGYGQAFVDKLIDVVQQMKMRPREIRVKRDIAYRLYEDIAAKLGIPIRQVPKLSVIEGIQKELAGFLGKR
ncbi:MAG TPA: hypothetical protein DCL63_03825 [Firmicutes bacterium]|nr:hypothetical protein [Bacillota bacterium]